MAKINHERNWYTTWYPPETGSCASSSFGSDHACWHFDSNFSDKMVLYIYEHDGGSPRDKVYTLYPGASCSWRYYSGDDYVDSAVMYRSNFPYNYDYKHDLGNAYVKWHKVH